MKGAEVLEKLRRKIPAKNNSELASRIGVTAALLSQWEQGSLTPAKIVNLVHKARKSAIKETTVAAISPIVEYYPVTPFRKARGKSYAIFETQKIRDHKSNKYKLGLKSELENSKGIYIFFDSRGDVIYLGKARTQFLWNEIHNAFNRDRGALQSIRIVSHPTSNVTYRSASEKRRQIKPVNKKLHEIAAYLSAYAVDESMIDNLEAILLRCFSNNIMNKRIENLAAAHPAKNKKPKKRRAKQKRVG
jgi:hypothetical protein